MIVETIITKKDNYPTSNQRDISSYKRPGNRQLSKDVQSDYESARKLPLVKSKDSTLPHLFTFCPRPKESDTSLKPTDDSR